MSPLANLTETRRCDMIIHVGRSKFLFRGSPVPSTPQQWCNSGKCTMNRPSFLRPWAVSLYGPGRKWPWLAGTGPRDRLTPPYSIMGKEVYS